MRDSNKKYYFVEIWKNFTSAQKKTSVGVMVVILFNSIIDIVGLSSVLPAISVTFNPGLIQSNAALKAVYDYFHFNSQQTFVLFLFSGAFFLILFRNAFSVFALWIQSNFANDFANDFSLRQLNYYMNQNLEFIRDNTTSTLTRYITVIPQHFSNFILQSYITIFTESFVSLIIIVSLIVLNPIIFLLMLFTLLPFTLVFYSIAKKNIQKNGVKQDKYSTLMNTEAYQAINGYVDVKVYSKEKYFSSRFEQYHSLLKKINVNLFVLKSLSGKIIELMAFMGVLLILVYATLISAGSNYILGLIGVYFTATYRLIPTYNRMLHAFLQIKEYSYIFGIYEKTFTSVSVKEQTSSPVFFKDNISFNNICFKYDQLTTNTIKELSFKIEKGEVIGIIGESGSGKTTLINILLRFMVEQTGTITVDGIILNEDNKTAWRNLIGYVQQNVFLIDADIYENIALGVERKNIDHDLIKEVVKLSNLNKLINQLPEGLNTRLGENGSKLSGGQKQRIAIARALYRNAEILIFDEATSALDNETEEEINNTIKNISFANKTIIIIAHRYSSLKNCTRILEMEKGTIKKGYQYADLAH